MTSAAPMMALHEALGWLSDARLLGDPLCPITRVHTDTRSIAAGDLFVALRGERFDANTLLEQAAAQGAAALLCQAGLPPQAYPAGLARIEVPDTRLALGQLAAGWRRRWNLPLIAVTGSNGKTTVTQMLAAILNAHAPDGAALATRGNLNNDIGVPLTLLRLRAEHRIAVVELGMNHPGEIAALAAMAQPGVALVNNAQREHLEFMHTVQAVALENGAVLAALEADGVAVYPVDDAYAPVWRQLAGARRNVGFVQALPAADAAAPAGAERVLCRSAHWHAGAWQVHALATLHGQPQDLHFALHIAGRHNVRNALAAAACALAAGVGPDAVERGLSAFVPVQGRSRALALTLGGHAVTLVDDSYNANPDSVRAAIDVLAELPGPRLLVLGDMGEVGSDGVALHAEVGRYAQARGIDQLLALGALVQHSVAACAGARHLPSYPELEDDVLAALQSGGYASVLVKGSRFMRMERAVQALERASAAAAQANTET